MEVTGLDHLYLTVSDLERSERFYDPVLEPLGFRKSDTAIAGEPHAHDFNPWLQVTIRPDRPGTPEHDPHAPGLHHVCLQVPDRATIDEAERVLRALGLEVTPAKEYPEYTPDDYAIFFADPDGIRLELIARSSHRKTIAERWKDFRTFLNPIGDLRRREGGS